MTPNEWWKEEPYYDKGQHCDDYYCHTDKGYNIEAIIEEVKRREREEAKETDEAYNKKLDEVFKFINSFNTLI